MYISTLDCDHWTCKCENDLFCITKDRTYCPNCGESHFLDASPHLSLAHKKEKQKLTRLLEQRDYLINVLRDIELESINAEFKAREAISAICAEEIGNANDAANT